MRTGDLVFIKGRSPISKLILYFDKGKWSHCAVAVSDTEIIEAQYFTRVKISKLEKYEEYEVVPMNLFPFEQEKIIAISRTLEGQWYDYRQIMYHVLKNAFKVDKGPFWNNPNALICSELVYILFRAVDRIYGDAYITPNELYLLVSEFIDKNSK